MNTAGTAPATTGEPKCWHPLHDDDCECGHPPTDWPADLRRADVCPECGGEAALCAGDHGP